MAEEAVDVAATVEAVAAGEVDGAATAADGTEIGTVNFFNRTSMEGSSAKRIGSVSALFLRSVCAFFFLSSWSLSAQQTPLDSKAAVIIANVKNTGGSKVLVCDFSGPKGLTALGIELADEFTRNISREGGGAVQPIDRSKILPLLHQVGLERENADSDLQGEIAAAQLSADDFVTGKLSVEGDEVMIELDLYNVGSDRRIVSVEAPVIMYAGAEKLLNTQIHDSPQGPYPFGGTGGYSVPQCTQCPNAEFTDLAVKKKVQGTVVLMATIGAEGRVESLYVLKGLPYGMNEASLAKVRSWQFKPATDPNGTPAAVRQTIDVVFHLYLY